MTADKDPEKDKDDLDASDWLASQFETAGIPTPEAPPENAAPPANPAPPADPPPLIPPAVVSPAPSTPIVPPTTESLGVPPSQFSWGLNPAAEAAEAPPPAPDLPATPEPLPPADPSLGGAPPAAAEPPPTEAMPIQDAPTQAFAGQELEQRPWEPWQARPIDPALDGATEVIEAEIIGLDGPEGESNPQSPIDDLFGDGRFREHDDATGVPPGGAPPVAPKRQWPPLSKNQKILLWVAGGIVAVLLLVALFLIGQRLSSTVGPAPEVTATPTPTADAGPVVIPAGPLPPGEYAWDELLGGECLAPFESAWQESYTVVDCDTPHPAQLVFRGQFDDAPDAAYPGFDELTTRIGLLCTAPTVINFQTAGTAQDIQISASFAVDAAEWDDGNRTFFCFANRSTGADLTASIALPQPATTLAPRG